MQEFLEKRDSPKYSLMAPNSAGIILDNAMFVPSYTCLDNAEGTQEAANRLYSGEPSARIT